MKTMADILRERGKLGPYTDPAGETPPDPSAADLIDITPDPGLSEPIERPRRRKQLPPVDF